MLTKLAAGLRLALAIVATVMLAGSAWAADAATFAETAAPAGSAASAMPRLPLTPPAPVQGVTLTGTTVAAPTVEVVPAALVAPPTSAAPLGVTTTTIPACAPPIGCERPAAADLAMPYAARSAKWSPMATGFYLANIRTFPVYWSSCQEKLNYNDAAAMKFPWFIGMNFYEIVQFPGQLALTPGLAILKPFFLKEQAEP